MPPSVSFLVAFESSWVNDAFGGSFVYCALLTGKERFNITLNGGKLVPGSTIRVTTDCGQSFKAKCRIDTDVEVEYFRNGGALHYVLRNLLTAK